jgi:hypothetical protein
MKNNIIEYFQPTLEYTQRQGYDFKDDKIFKDVFTYENDQNLSKLGIDKCLEYCAGNCVEYGQTGTAYCFPFITDINEFAKNDLVMQQAIVELGNKEKKNIDKAQNSNPDEIVNALKPLPMV